MASVELLWCHSCLPIFFSVTVTPTVLLAFFAVPAIPKQSCAHPTSYLSLLLSLSLPGIDQFCPTCLQILPIPTIHHYIRTFYGMAVKLDLEGRIVGSLQDTNGSVVRDVAEVVEHEGFFYFGNYDSTHLARLDKRNLLEAL